MHQVTLASLHCLRKKAYQKYCSDIPAFQEANSLDVWCQEREADSQQFSYWSVVMELQLVLLLFVRSLRTSNFSLYVHALQRLVPCFFLTDQPNYARWVSVHIRDMLQLQTQLPPIHQAFMEGKFTVAKTKNSFSSIAIDQAHEQANVVIKGDGGAIGLTENPKALRRWMVAGPEVARLITEFENDTISNKDHRHHEQTPAAQASFKKDVQSLVATIDTLGNPFEESGEDLISLSSKVIVQTSLTKKVQQVRELGKEQYRKFVNERFMEHTVPLESPIP